MPGFAILEITLFFRKNGKKDASLREKYIRYLIYNILSLRFCPKNYVIWHKSSNFAPHFGKVMKIFELYKETIHSVCRYLSLK